jgi:hypothetical protein
MLRFDVRPRALWTNPNPPSARYRLSNRYNCRSLNPSSEAAAARERLPDSTSLNTGKYYVVAGGRRLTAMKGLHKEGKLPDDFEVACKVKETNRLLN